MTLKNFRGAKSIHAVVLGGMLVSTVLSGCQTTNRYKADYANDVCRVQRDALQETGNHFAADMVAGAVKGAMVGAIAGGLSAALTGGNVGKAVLVGVVAGGATGFGAGYFNSLAKQQGQSSTGLFAAFQSDLQRDTEQLAKTQRAFDGLIDCRRQEVASVKSAVKAGGMTRQDGEVKMAEIRQKIAEDRRVGREIMNNVEDRTAQYAVAGAKLGVPEARRRAEAAYGQKIKTSGSSLEKPDLKTVISQKDAQSPEYKKMGASISNYASSADKAKQADSQLASIEGSTGFS